MKYFTSPQEIFYFEKNISDACREISFLYMSESSEKEETATESIMKQIFERIKEFVQKMKLIISDAIYNIQNKVREKLNGIAVRAKIMEARKLAKANTKTHGMIEFIDVWKMEETITKTCGIVQKALDKWWSEARRSGKMAIQADLLLRKCDRKITDMEKVVSKLRTHKIKVDANKALSWLELTTTATGKLRVTSSFSQLQERLVVIESQLGSIEKTAREYCERNHVVFRPNTFVEVTKHISLFMRDNIDWITAYGISGVLNIAAMVEKRKSAMPEFGDSEKHEKLSGAFATAAGGMGAVGGMMMDPVGTGDIYQYSYNDFR